MKTQLTIEQSAQLIELGVDPSKASEGKAFPDTSCGCGIDVNMVAAITLVDLLELLPKEIHDETWWPHKFCLNIHVGSAGVWRAEYHNFAYSKTIESISAPELIDALYELLCWTIKNGYVES